MQQSASIILDGDFIGKFMVCEFARFNAFVLPHKQRCEQGLLRMALSGYASVYKMNANFPFAVAGCGCVMRGAEE